MSPKWRTITTKKGVIKVAHEQAQVNHITRGHERAYGAQYHQHPRGMSGLAPLMDSAPVILARLAEDFSRLIQHHL